MGLEQVSTYLWRFHTHMSCLTSPVGATGNDCLGMEPSTAERTFRFTPIPDPKEGIGQAVPGCLRSGPHAVFWSSRRDAERKWFQETSEYCPESIG